MALPGLTLPAGTPGFVAEGHSVAISPLYATVPMRTGHARLRPLFTVSTRMVTVVTYMNRAQLLAFYEWFEGPLRAGDVQFSAPVKNLGPGMRWWAARFVEPYTAEPVSSQHSRVTARLLLTGEGSVEGPVSSELSAAIVIALAGTATATQPPSALSAEVVIALESTNRLSAAILIELVSSFATYRLREGGNYRLREGDDKRRREHDDG